MKVLVLSKYSRKGASSRYRMYQFYSSLHAHGFQLRTEPLFDDDYLDRVYGGKPRILSVIKRYFNRLKVLLQARNYDVLWIEKELLPWIPWAIEGWFLKRMKTAYIVDYDDAIFHQYDQHRWSLIRKLLGSKCDQVMKAADCVVAGNGYLRQRAQLAGARKVIIVPTVIPEKVFCPADPQNSIPVIGWIGSKSTAVYLEKLRPILSQLAKHHQFKFRVIGATVDWPDCPVEIAPWSEEEEPLLVKSLDIGVMPLLDSPWERGKCGFKLIQYMACGKPVVADSVGVNSEIVQHESNGYLISENCNWHQALATLLIDSNQRRLMGQRGREIFIAKYSLEKWQGQIYQIMKDCRRK